MRKLSVLGGAVLALAVASSVFAATPSTVPASSTAPAPAAHHWTASAKADGLTVRARLFAGSAYHVGWVQLAVRGLKRGAKVEIVIADQTTSTTILDVTRTVRSHRGVRAFLVHLDAAELAALKADVTAKDTLTITVTSGTATATGTFAPAKG